ncbi:TadE/TadG family type IV pilus assembly protein [Sphingorhabdus sp.]|uniref:TadE/TadG family type IV pilus assembly protein n=1 Tax=Sphingorhabdus sp. TaxID=1902408 RepID=UPI00391C15F3
MTLPVLDLVSDLQRDDDGASVVEFALIAPIAMFMLLGTMDIGHSYYVRATLDGAIQTAARNSSLETSATPQAQQFIDNRVKETVLTLAPTATFTATRRYYKTFSDAASSRAEIIIEDPSNANQKCDPGEIFIDANHNGVWDADGGSDGQGGAKDIVIINYKVSYPRLFPMARAVGWPSNIEIQSNSVLANQPYGEQTEKSVPVQANCPPGK